MPGSPLNWSFPIVGLDARIASGFPFPVVGFDARIGFWIPLS
jgi:hypothetical protein